MGNELQMTLNRLPAPTWNWLRMNESHVTYEGTPIVAPVSMELSGDELAKAEDVSAAKLEEKWNQIVSGVGSELDELGTLAGGTIKVLETKEGSQERENESYAVLTYDYQAGDSANCLYLHAKEHSTLHVTMVLTGDQNQKGSASVQVKAHAEENSYIKIYAVQLLGNGFTCFHDLGGVCEEDAWIELVRVELGAGTLYAGGEVDLKGKESSFEAHIGYHARTGQKLDMNYTVRHHGKKTVSLMEASGILEEGSSKLFRGTIDFLRGCSGAKGDEREDILMLGDDLVNQTIPLILCQEEEVEGNHGASMGKLDDSVLYYLSSRGIPEEKAEQIMARAKIDAVCDRIPQESVRKQVREYLGTEEEINETV